MSKKKRKKCTITHYCKCEYCQKYFEIDIKRTLYCGAACRQANYRANKILKEDI
jgi:hypothetical protein